MRTMKRLVIEPFDAAQLNPNSYNYRLGPELGIPVVGDDGAVSFRFEQIPPGGFLLERATTYLGHTLEVLGSDTFAMSLIGRSSVGRLGLFLQVSANLGHTGSCHQWTLEMVAAKPFRIYAGMRIGQISFWCNEGTVSPYTDGYTLFDSPTVSSLLTAASDGEV
jgi:dCTP deaminase